MAPKGYWQSVLKDVNEQKRIIDWLSAQLSIKCLEDWYRVSINRIQTMIQIESWKILAQILETVHSEHNWDIKTLRTIGRQSKSSQRELMLAVQQLFPEHRTFKYFDI